MDKILAKLIAEALAPVVALLTEINNKLAVATGVAAIQEPAALANAARHSRGQDPIPAAVSPAASNITREALGQSLLSLAKRDEVGMAAAQKLLLKYVPADQEMKTLAFVPVDKYDALAKEIAEAIIVPAAPKAESLI